MVSTTPRKSRSLVSLAASAVVIAIGFSSQIHRFVRSKYLRVRARHAVGVGVQHHLPYRVDVIRFRGVFVVVHWYLRGEWALGSEKVSCGTAVPGGSRWGSSRTGTSCTTPIG